jgi:cell division protein FtsW (lipid II flippase)
MLHIMLFLTLNALKLYLSTYRSMCAVPKMTVIYFTVILCFPAMLLEYFMNDFGMVLIVTFITGIIYFLKYIHIIIIIVIIGHFC